MAEITRERQGTLVRGLFEILKAHPDGLATTEALTGLEQAVPPTEFELTFYPNKPSLRRYEKIVRFSTIAPVKAGWMIKRKAIWTVTPEGLDAMQTFPDAADFAREASRLYRVWKKSQPEDLDEASDDNDTETIPEITIEQAEETAWNEIAQYIGQINPYEFQDLVAALLEAMGYHALWIAPQGPDRGIDIIAYNDPLGTSSPRIKVQVKRRQDKIAVDGLRAFLAVLGDEDVGIFISVGGFTSDAMLEARTQERRRITLIDIRQLVDLWVDHYDSLTQEQRQLLPLRPVYYLAPRD